MSSARWVLGAGVLGVAASAVLSSALHLPRDLFIAGYGVAVLVFLALLLRFEPLDPMLQLRRRWLSGVIGGVIVGGLLARTVVLQPASPAPAGGALAWALAWNGVFYGVVDGMLLSVLPVLLIYGGRPAAELQQPGARWRWALTALGASLLLTAAYHLGFTEYRNDTLMGPLAGNAVVTLSYLVTGSPIAPLLSHVLMHGAAVLHGMATTTQLPPHY